MKKNLKDYELNELKTILGNMGEASYRAGQIFAWLYKGAESFEEMKNIPMALRENRGRVLHGSAPPVLSSSLKDRRDQKVSI